MYIYDATVPPYNNCPIDIVPDDIAVIFIVVPVAIKEPVNTAALNALVEPVAVT